MRGASEQSFAIGQEGIHSGRPAVTIPECRAHDSSEAEFCYIEFYAKGQVPSDETGDMAANHTAGNLPTSHGPIV